MNKFKDIVFILPVAVILFFIGAQVGYKTTRGNIANDCKLFGMFRLNQEVFVCSSKSNEAKQSGENDDRNP